MFFTPRPAKGEVRSKNLMSITGWLAGPACSVAYVALVELHKGKLKYSKINLPQRHFATQTSYGLFWYWTSRGKAQFKSKF
jgi:hypothetical protein